MAEYIIVFSNITKAKKYDILELHGGPIAERIAGPIVYEKTSVYGLYETKYNLVEMQDDIDDINIINILKANEYKDLTNYIKEKSGIELKPTKKEIKDKQRLKKIMEERKRKAIW